VQVSGHSDAIVVGGGLVGSAVALGLADAGLSVRVLDEADTAFRASVGNFGLVWVQGKGLGLPAYAAWTRTSADLWPGFAERLCAELGADIGYRKPGGLHFCMSEEELEERALLLRRMHNQSGAQGYDCRLLDHEEVRALVPGLGPDVAGGSYCPHDGHVSPLLLLRALHTAMAARKVAYLPGHRVQAIRGDGGAFRVESTAESFGCRTLVLAAGLGNRTLGPMVGLDIPVSPLKGQILVSERTPPFLDNPTAFVRQTGEGTVLMGDSHEDVGVDVRSTPGVMAEIARRAVRTFPALEGVRAVRAWGALRVMSPDGHPVYHASESHPGAFGLACHSGVTLAAAHAQRLAPAIADGSFRALTAPFDPGRFHAAVH
jgi:glycine/D-amino acid oxidase-like deaminating enzyme